MTRTADHRSSAPGTGRRVEFVRFHLRPDETSSVLEARRAWSAAHRGGDGYLGGLLVAFDDDEWLEITVWDEALPPEPVSTDGAGAGFVDGIASPRTEIVERDHQRPVGTRLLEPGAELLDHGEAAIAETAE